MDWFSGTGKGGQHRNKHKNCCRITHIETGLTAQGTDHRERTANQRDAFQRLARLVVSHLAPEAQKARITEGETIRNYHAVRNEVHDKASGLKQPYKKVVIGGDIADMVEARRAAL